MEKIFLKEIQKLKEELKKLQEELYRCQDYLQSREVKYCEKCKCYGDEGLDINFYNHEYLCYNCSHEYNL